MVALRGQALPSLWRASLALLFLCVCVFLHRRLLRKGRRKHLENVAEEIVIARGLFSGPPPAPCLRPRRARSTVCGSCVRLRRAVYGLPFLHPALRSVRATTRRTLLRAGVSVPRRPVCAAGIRPVFSRLLRRPPAPDVKPAVFAIVCLSAAHFATLRHYVQTITPLPPLLSATATATTSSVTLQKHRFVSPCSVAFLPLARDTRDLTLLLINQLLLTLATTRASFSRSPRRSIRLASA